MNTTHYKVPDAYIEEITFDDISISSFANKKELEKKYRGQVIQYFLNYPAVYILHHSTKKSNYYVYVGESSNVDRRLAEHYKAKEKLVDENNNRLPAETYIVTHPFFNKSLTLDIENRIIQYMLANPNVGRLINGRENAQGAYYTKEYFDQIFNNIWSKLRAENSQLFISQVEARDSAIFKASPFHALTPEQTHAEEQILDAIAAAMDQEGKQKLIIVEGEAGSGKTVLLSHLFRRLHLKSEDVDEANQTRQKSFENGSHFLLSPQNELLKVYTTVAQKLGLHDRDRSTVMKPVQLWNRIENHSEKPDVVLIDEAHLLLTQGNQAYQGKDQLKDLITNSRVVVAIYDQKQIQQTNQYVSQADYVDFKVGAERIINLTSQLRMQASEETVDWIRSFVDDGQIKNLPHDDPDYDLQIFSSPTELQLAIRSKAAQEDSQLSRVLATFDWEYSSQRRPKQNPETDNSTVKQPLPTWNVEVPDYDFSMPWNLQLKASPGNRRVADDQSWPERAHTIDEVGSIYTIQGLDLNYAGVILGPSVRLEGEKVVIDPTKSKNRHATQRRTFADGKKGYVSTELLKNQLNVLMTRGVNGLYIFAVDEALRNKLLELQRQRG